jgi:hypothetical protein
MCVLCRRAVEAASWELGPVRGVESTSFAVAVEDASFEVMHMPFDLVRAVSSLEQLRKCNSACQRLIEA